MQHTTFIKSVYAFTLHYLSTEQVLRFWEKFPLRLRGKIFRGKKLFEYFWNERGTTPQTYSIAVLTALEPYCIECGKNFKRIWIESLRKKIMIPAKHFLWASEPDMKYLFTGKDVRDATMRLAPDISETTNPDTPFLPLKFYTTPDGMRNILFMVPLDRYYQDNLPPFDFESLIIPLMQYVPFVFGGAAIKKFTLHCQCIQPSDIVRKSNNPHMRNGIFYINGKRYGRRMRLYDFLKNKKLEVTKYPPPDRDIIVIEKQYRCSFRKRVVLHKDCAYGAPMCLWTYHYPAKPKRYADISEILREVKYPEESIYSTLEKKHYALVNRLEDTISVKYSRKQKCVMVNGQYLTCGTQGKILSRIVKLHAKDGRTEFERRELTADRSLVSDPLDTGFSTRLNRIAKRLERISPQIRIVKYGRGKFRLVTQSKIDYQER